MNISDLQSNQEGVNLTLTVVSVDEPKEFNKYGKVLRLANAIVTDGSGEVKMSFWNENIDKIKPGVRFSLENGYCSEFRGEKQLTLGKNGKFVLL